VPLGGTWRNVEEGREPPQLRPEPDGDAREGTITAPDVLAPEQGWRYNPNRVNLLLT
jgi:hypothetical protein